MGEDNSLIDTMEIESDCSNNGMGEKEKVILRNKDIPITGLVSVDP